jgi:hypothetical protein
VIAATRNAPGISKSAGRLKPQSGFYAIKAEEGACLKKKQALFFNIQSGGIASPSQPLI